MIQVNLIYYFNRYWWKFCLISSFISIICLILGFYKVWHHVPYDYLQGIYVKIMYVHVPSAWLSLGIYVVMTSFAIGYLTFRNPIFDILAISSSSIGIALTLVTLITGAIWGSPTWGTWWVWDARLTSMLILFFLYMCYNILHHSFKDKERAAKVSAIFAIMGLFNIPIIKFSVNLWSTLHQPASVLRIGGSTIHSTMLWPLILVFLGFFFFSITLIVINAKAEIYKRKNYIR